MRRLAVPALLAGALVWIGAVAADRELVLFDAPRGAWLGALKSDASFVVLEKREGWSRVRVEGWIPAPEADGAAPSLPSSASAGQGTLQGVLAPPVGNGGAPGAGVLVLLVNDDESLEREHRAAGVECGARLERKNRDLQAITAEVNRALNSSDNFREASSRSDQARQRLAREQTGRRELLQECRLRAQALFEGSVVERAISDGSGRFAFPGMGPGRYRVVAFETTGDAPRAWSFSLVWDGEGSRVLDPAADRSPVAADWGLR